MYLTTELVKIGGVTRVQQRAQHRVKFREACTMEKGESNQGKSESVDYYFLLLLFFLTQYTL
jgi:hypothetical protein